ncbi:MAG: hypothetical protein NXI24_24585 [bacterium]|nr:hypothetical protein [bacterium]
MNHIKWPSIESFAHVRKAVEVYGEKVGPNSIAHQGPIVYRAKIKLHGTNAGISFQSGAVVPQSRSAVLSTQSDNAGFARWVESTAAAWQGVLNRFEATETTTIFGEWCGPGIQKGAAICGIPEKIFAVFALQVGDLVHIDPDWIADRLGSIPNVHVLPWQLDRELSIDWTSVDSMRAAVDYINTRVEEIDGLDPYVRERFQIEGPGEGLVWYPVSLADVGLDRDDLGSYLFKTKGEKHQVVRAPKAASVDPEVAQSIDDFVNIFVTENRLLQIAGERCGGDYDPKNIGPFIGVFAADVRKESTAELDAAGLEWKQVQKAVSATARTWFLRKIEEI